MIHPTRGAGAVSPVQADNITAAIERTYRESGPYQWVRETLRNALEAGATRVEYGLELQALDKLGVYRRVIADDGCGMSADELRRFFKTFGGGGKPIGGEHENFGMGAKTSLLPWNRSGLVIISLKDGALSMIRMVYDEAKGVYGLLNLEVYDPETGDMAIDEVYEPYDGTENGDGCDWMKVVPQFVKDTGHGTVLVLLGNQPDANTMKGDPSREEADTKGLSVYLNNRFWEIPEATKVYVDEIRSWDAENAPRTSDDWLASSGNRRRNRRQIRGAGHYVTDYDHETARLIAKGTVQVDESTEVDWYLWRDRPPIHAWAPENGFIATLYRGELYGFTEHPSTYRSFGVSEKSVRKGLFLIVRPKEFDEASRYGIYPRGDRNALLMRGGPNPGGELPILHWGAAFADQLPEPVKAAIQQARAANTDLGDTSWMQRLKERFGRRWRVQLRVVSPSGSSSVTPASPHTDHHPRPHPPVRRSRTGAGGEGATAGSAGAGTRPGPVQARATRAAGGIPDFDPVREGDIEEGLLAAWSPNEGECGKVKLNIDHEVIKSQIEYWQEKYPPHQAEAITECVIQVYGQLACARVAHTEGLKAIYPTHVIDAFRTPHALTMSLLGLVGEDAIIATRLGGQLGSVRRSAN